MKICIFGADGRTGIELVTYAKSKGLDIAAFVFNENLLSHAQDGVQIVQGSVLEYSSVLKACTGVDVVVSALGHIPGSDSRMQTKGMINIVQAMKESKVQRIISLTGTGVRLPQDTPSIMDMILNYIVKIIDRDRIEDGIQHAKVLQGSGLDWTIIRVLKLGSSQTAVEKYMLTSGGPVELLTSRKKVSKIMIDVIENKDYYYTMPVVSA